MEELLNRGVEQIFPNRAALEKRLKQKPVKLYHGIDPTAPTLHLGHLATLLKVRDFQTLGHEAIILFGNFTATIGDPTDKLAARIILSPSEVDHNLKDYQRQILKILDPQKTTFRYNADWYNQMKLADLVSLTTKITIQQLLKREMFRQRQADGKDIYLNEFLYPIFHGYDSVELDVDLEIGGNDQLFNMLVGRDLLKKLNNREKFVLTTKLLIDSNGRKMGKTNNNFIALNDSAEEIYAKIMSWPDKLMPIGFEILTRIPTTEYQKILSQHPKTAKMILARTLTALLWGEKEADQAEVNFRETFSGANPTGIKTVSVKTGTKLLDILLSEKLVSSKSEFRRLVEGGGIEIVGQSKINEENFLVSSTITIRVGKHRFLEIICGH